ncbi:hypothetical protein [Planotetraspora mira]|uniref:Uncharacterized protein n=1 Tax=Planotetraspora mira TaxID=58121 RepID=A0A8J3TZW8_9ACTN|nr:hypothetical protein [Planotetraspora mira]GII34347.1 hypothetical protein Pmi06nite_77890 [Planotetraspora mira]
MTAACVVHVPIATQAGTALGTLYRDAVFVGDPDSDKIRHLLDSGMVVEFGQDGQAVTAGAVDKPAPAPAKPGAETPQVTARSTKPELVDYAVDPRPGPRQGGEAHRQGTAGAVRPPAVTQGVSPPGAPPPGGSGPGHHPGGLATT